MVKIQLFAGVPQFSCSTKTNKVFYRSAGIEKATNVMEGGEGGGSLPESETLFCKYSRCISNSNKIIN